MREAIGRFRVVGQLGEGGMGVVYDAWDDRLGRAVAVKTIRAALEDPSARERFWREAAAAARSGDRLPVVRPGGRGHGLAQ